MVKKLRTPIPSDVADEVLFSQDHTCCICRERGKPVQIHHINGDPSDNRSDNLAVLCLHDHDRTLQRGGFGRTLTEGEVTKYRDDWLVRVERRYERGITKSEFPPIEEDLPISSTLLLPLIESLPAMRASIHRDAHRGWDTGITAAMNQSTYDAVDAVQQVWLLLARAYPPRHFDLAPTAHYLRSFTADRFLWHRAVHQPLGEGTSGTILGQLVGGGVLADLEEMVEDTVEALFFAFELEALDLPAWRERWSSAAEVD
jgi:hypothetical protein